MIRLFLTSLAMVCAMSVAAMACPSAQAAGASYSFTGQDLYAPKTFGVQASGQFSLSNCGLGNVGSGYFNAAPSYTLDLTGMQDYRLVLDVDSQCDSALLVLGADNQWYFDDDSNGNLDPMITLGSAAQTNGRVNVWVGTFGGSSCGGSLNLETFYAQAPAPQQSGSCPTFQQEGLILNYSGQQLYSPQTFSVSATGGTSLDGCNGMGVGAWGHASTAPQYTLYLSGMQEYDLEIQVEAQCDSVLLVNTADGQWHFDDDSNGNLNPMMRLSGLGALEGRVDVWVGSYGGVNCPASVEFETWLASSGAVTPAPSGGGNCPSFAYTGATFSLTGDDLYSRDSFQSQAMGGADVNGCGLPGFGYASQAPQYSFYLSGMDAYRLEMIVNSSCDTTLLVNTADGQWFYDDDSAGNLNPLLNLRGGNLLNGRVDVWLGSYSGAACPATLSLETWNN